MSRRFANFNQRLNAPVGNSDQPNENTGNPEVEEEDPQLEDNEKPEKDTIMTDDVKAAEATAHAAGRAEALDDMTAVFASDLFVGREAAAAKLLSKNMRSDDVIDMLADLPENKPEMSDAQNSEQKEAAEEAARIEMKNEMEKAGNADLGTGASGDDKSKSAAADDVWSAARAANEKLKGV